MKGLVLLMLACASALGSPARASMASTKTPSTTTPSSSATAPNQAPRIETRPQIAAEAASTACTIMMELSGTVGPATLDLYQRAMLHAQEQRCGSMLLVINTPGGSLQTTRLIVEAILNAPMPVLCIVAPAGAHAGSAGAIILQACHVNGAMEATNLGAATPVAGGGQEIPEDLKKKLMNDTRSWLEGITKLRGRSEKFGQDIIVEAKAVSAEEAKRLGAIDVVVTTKEAFLDFARGREVKMAEDKKAVVRVGPLMTFSRDLRYRTLDLLTDPQTAYLILMGSLALIYFEITHPGTLVAGVFGGIGLVVSLVALHKLDVEWGGLALMLLGIALLIAEAFVPSFGILGVGGITSFILGSLFLFDPSSGYQLPLTLILPTAGIIGGVMLAIAFMLLKTRSIRRRGGFDDVLGETGIVVSLEPDGQGKVGQVEVGGETWRFEAQEAQQVKDVVKVISHHGITLKVEKQSKKHRRGST